jgi:predicted pyridoxine 5'-phosphate oxidase superfamily flavin-nucleotide-binding protein
MCELFRTPRATVPREIAWCGKDHAARIGKLPHCEIRIRQIADPNGEIVASADEIDIAVGQNPARFRPSDGNKQYITTGNLTENDRVILFLIDYERGRRLKVWGHGFVIDDDAALLDRVKDSNYPAKVERAILVDVIAWDLNCRQHFPKLVRERKHPNSMA